MQTSSSTTEPHVCAFACRFTGKERDSESGNDYFGARYYSSSVGRWLSPDSLNLTDDRLLNPSNTLNKYAYGANNPLKYLDLDGRDITVFYESPSISSFSAGHIMFVAENQQTGDAAAMSFGPVRSGYGDAEMTLVGFPMTSTNSFGLANMTADDLRQNFSSLTIQTSPEEAQQVIDFIRNNPDFEHQYTLYDRNCTTVCREALKIIGKLSQNNKNWTPNGLWHNIFAHYANSWWQNNVGWAGSQTGIDYGQRPGNYDPFELLEILSRPDNSSVTTSQGPGTPCGGSTGTPCPQ